MTPDLSQVPTWLIEYRYILLFPIVVLEGPIITVIAGWLSSLGYLNIFIAYIVIVIGDLVGDSLYYSMGYWGQNRWLEKYGQYIGLSPHTIRSISPLFHTYGGKTLVIAKLSHAAGMVFLIGAGLTRMPYGKFLWYNFIATLPKSLAFILIGYYYGYAYIRIDQYLRYSVISLVVLAILAIIISRTVARYVDKKVLL